MYDPPHDARAPFASEESVGARFAQQASKTPDHPAIVMDDETVTFAELEMSVERVATALASYEGAPDEPIALIMREGPLLYAVMLAVAKLGRIFVPLDSNSPEAWLAEIVMISGARFIVCDQRTRDLALRVAGERSTVLESETLNKFSAPPRPYPLVSIDTIACILYTSGSTGRSKGVAIPHRAKLHRASVRRKHLHADDRMAHVRSSIFAGGINDLFAALLSGVTLCPYDIKARGLPDFSQWLVTNRITGLIMSSSVLRAWLDTISKNFQLPDLRLVVAASEPLYGADVRRLARHLQSQWTVVNQLGSTETGPLADYVLGPASALEDTILPVGRAVEDVEIILEDENGSPVTGEEVGEIVVCSRNIAVAYWKEPTLTRERFLSDPRDATIIVYRMGDLGRRRSDGFLEFFGRKDRKIKLRGHSVELYEVEQALLRLPGAREAVVIVQEMGGGKKRLIGYISTDDYLSAKSQALRSQLFASMPTHMVPSEIVALQSLPLTVRGKGDRKALPSPEAARRRDKPAKAPESEIEKHLVPIWKEVLKQEGLGTDDDFFIIGGDSLQATQLILEIEKTFGVVLSAELMFGDACTITGMAKEIERAPKSSGNASTTIDVDFARFEPKKIDPSKRGVFWVDPRTSMRRPRPNAVFGKVVFNSQGYRNPEVELPKPAGTVRLGFLGGSTTIDEFVSGNDVTWPHLACNNLRRAFPGKALDYVNGGMPGFHLNQMSRLYREYMSELGCDAVVLWSNDLTSITSYLARKQGIFHGAHFQPSALAKKNAQWMWLEKNLIVLQRLVLANFSAGKLKVTPSEIGDEFEERLEDFVLLCQEKCPIVAVMTSAPRLRRSQSTLTRMVGGSTNVLFMPFMSYDGLLDAFDIIDDVIRKVGKRTGALVIEPRDHIPSDGTHYLDSGHLLDPGSRVLADVVSDAFANYPPFRALLD